MLILIIHEVAAASIVQSSNVILIDVDANSS